VPEDEERELPSVAASRLAGETGVVVTGTGEAVAAVVVAVLAPVPRYSAA
jgi:hypothetical protein